MPPRLPRLSAADSDSLWQAYKSHRTPRDQLDRKPRVLRGIRVMFNLLTGLEWSNDMVYRAIFTRCKNPNRYGWGNHNGDFEKLASMPEDFIPLEYFTDLCAVYQEIDRGADEYKIDASLRADFADRFEERTGFRPSTHGLGAYLVDVRKSGRLVKLNPSGPSGGFDDFDRLPDVDDKQ